MSDYLTICDEHVAAIAPEIVLDGWGPIFGPRLFVVIINVFIDSIARLCISECRCDVFPDKPRLIVDDGRANIAELWIVENF